MIIRNLLNNVINSLQHFPVVGLIGSRQVGKTTLAKLAREEYPSSVYLDLELPSDYNKLQNAELFFGENSSRLIIIDEIQRMPSIFPLIRAMVDQDRRDARFLILGSASPTFIKGASESLAGRIIYHELTPFSFSEIDKTPTMLNDLWLKGGYPLSYLENELEVSYKWRDAFIKTYLEQDLPQLGLRIPSIQLRRFWTMLAHNHGKLWNSSQLALSLGVTAPTVKNYLDILTDTFVVRQLSPYFPNLKKRIVKSPKIYIRDSGLLHNLLGIKNYDQLLSNPLVGFSWEGFIIEQIFELVKDEYEVYFYRTGGGAEIDLVLTKNNIPEIAIEIKLSLEPKISKGFWNSFEQLNCKKGFIIYPGSDTYSINERIKVTNLLVFPKLIG